MKDNLKNRFQEEDFLEIDPLEGHEHRFETKLLFSNQSRKKKSGKPFFLFLAAACMLGLIISIALFQTNKENVIVEKIKTEKKNERMSLADISHQAAFQEEYFQKEINKRVLLKSDDPSLKPIFDKLKILEEQHITIQEQLIENVYNENLINALLNNYKLRLEVLEKLQKIIEFKNKSKDASHEKNNKS